MIQLLLGDLLFLIGQKSYANYFMNKVIKVSYQKVKIMQKEDDNNDQFGHNINIGLMVGSW
jgi:hypothetical protein